MKTITTKHENISAMADGELSDMQLDAMLSSVMTEDGRDTWEIYHQIGDVLRSEELAVKFSDDFSKRLLLRLDAEPAILAPRAQSKTQDHATFEVNKKNLRSYLTVAGVAAAAVFAFVLSPQLSHLRGYTTPGMQLSKTVPQESGVQLASSHAKSEAVSVAENDDTEAGAYRLNQGAMPPDMLRDPRIDSYLIAHQRFSPSIGTGAQYVTRANAVTPAAEK